MSSIEIAILVVHYALLLVLCAFGAHRLHMTFVAWRAFPRVLGQGVDRLQKPLDNAPVVTVQAPLYNEKYVVERLITALALLDYPKDKLQIQIIDDSSDETVAIAANAVARYSEQGVDISHVRRSNREGYKAGALQNALTEAKGEFVAVFDADFIPEPDFLKRIVPVAVEDSNIAMVQSRWRHLNTDSNLLTRVQSIILDAHFAIEHVARFVTGAFFNFNGTAGLWRKQALVDAGGWQSDTLTEDLDISYRAQLKGWRFAYVADIGCPSELPTDMQAFKTQQHRWAKGAIEVMKKLLASVWRSDVSLRGKVEATFHLASNFSYVCLLIDSVFFLLPAIHIREQAGWGPLTWLDIPMFVLATGSHAAFFIASQKILYGKFIDKLGLLPGLFATSIGLCVNNGRAVGEAVLGHVTGFVRTPKTGEVSEPEAGQSVFAQLGGAYSAMSARWADYLEVFLAALYIVYLFWAVLNGYWIVTPFLALFALGFLYTGVGGVSARLNFSDRKILNARAQRT